MKISHPKKATPEVASLRLKFMFTTRAIQCPVASDADLELLAHDRFVRRYFNSGRSSSVSRRKPIVRFALLNKKIEHFKR